MIRPQNTQSAQSLSQNRFSDEASLSGLGKMYQLIGDDMDTLIEELNGELTA